MPRPVPMTRALIVGPRENLEATVERLYGLKLVHIVDHREGEEGLEIGRPLPTASEASEILVKLRSIASVLQLEETPPAPTDEVAGDLREKIHSLELNISEEDAAKKKTQALLQELNRKIDEVRPFSQLPLSLADYRGYDTLEVFVGKVAGEIEDLDSVTPDYEAFSAPGLLAVFVPKPQAAAMRDFLTQHGFTSIPVPEGDGDPREILSNLLTERERWEARLQAVLPRDRSDVGPDLHVPDLLRPHGGRRRLRARVDGLRNLAASTLEGPGVGLLEEPPRHAHMGWILVPPVRRLLLRGGIRDPVPPCGGRDHPGRAPRLVRDPRGQHPAPRAAREARTNHGLHRAFHPRGVRPPGDRVRHRIHQRSRPQPEARAGQGRLAAHPDGLLRRHDRSICAMAVRRGGPHAVWVPDLEQAPRLVPAGGIRLRPDRVRSEQSDSLGGHRHAPRWRGATPRNGGSAPHHGILRPPGQHRLLCASCGGRSREGGHGVRVQRHRARDHDFPRARFRECGVPDPPHSRWILLWLPVPLHRVPPGRPDRDHSSDSSELRRVFHQVLPRGRDAVSALR